MSKRKPKNETPAHRRARLAEEQKIALGYAKAKKREKAAKWARVVSWSDQTEALLARRRAQP